MEEKDFRDESKIYRIVVRSYEPFPSPECTHYINKPFYISDIPPHLCDAPGCWQRRQSLLYIAKVSSTSVNPL